MFLGDFSSQVSPAERYGMVYNPHQQSRCDLCKHLKQAWPAEVLSALLLFQLGRFHPFLEIILSWDKGTDKGTDKGWAETLRFPQGSTHCPGGVRAGWEPTSSTRTIPSPTCQPLQPQKAGFHTLLCPPDRLGHSGSSLLLPGPTYIHIPRSSPSKIYPPGREEKEG